MSKQAFPCILFTGSRGKTLYTDNPFYDRQLAFTKWKNIAVLDIDPAEGILVRGKEIMQKNIKQKDALHIACAIIAECGYFLTTDRKILNKNIPEIKLLNPLDFIRQFYIEGDEK